MITFEEYFIQLKAYLTSINARSGRAPQGYFEKMDLSLYAEDLESIHLKILDKLIEEYNLSCVIDESNIFAYECSQLKQKLIDYIEWLKDRGEVYNEDLANKAEALSDELSEAVDVVLKTVLPVDKWDLGPLGGGHYDDIGGWGGVKKKPSSRPFLKDDNKDDN